jgi:hypothetical protein
MVFTARFAKKTDRCPLKAASGTRKKAIGLNTKRGCPDCSRAAAPFPHGLSEKIDHGEENQFNRGLRSSIH